MTRIVLLCCAFAGTLAGLEVAKAEQRWLLRLQTYHMWEVNDDNTAWTALSIGGGHSFIDRVELYGDLALLEADLPDSSAEAGILDLTVRLRMLRRPRYTVFLDAGVGLFWADHRVPSSGSRFNFTELGALGVELPLRNDFAFSIAFRYMHVSNAGLFENARNPGLDGMGFQVGLIRRF